MADELYQLYTYGYGNGDMEDLKRWASGGIAIADIRYSPRSANPDWSKDNLSRVLGRHYHWLFPLGNKNYKVGGKPYIPLLQEGLAQLRDLMEFQPVVLLCVCPDVEKCHRTIVANEAARLFGAMPWHLRRGDDI